MSPDKKKGTGYTDPTFLNDSDFSKSICSATDCTGLIPALPDSDAELEAYEEMYQFCMTNASPNTGYTPKAAEERSGL